MLHNQTKGNLALAPYDDIFNVSKISDGECVVEISLTELHPPELHPFNIFDDDAMLRLTESVKLYGVREPGLVRPRTDGYELLCGNRRKRACELAGKTTMPVIIRELDDANATLVMVDSNLDQREKILPSEKAWAYKIMIDALNHNGIKGEKHSHEIMVERTGESKNQIYRIIRLTELIAALADMVDANRLAFNPAVELSYLSIKDQTAVFDTMRQLEVKPSLSQAQRMKKSSQSGGLSFQEIESILSETKKPQKDEPSGFARFRKYFPSDYTQKQMDKVIIDLLIAWKTGA